jgi:hypothetical protein
MKVYGKVRGKTLKNSSKGKDAEPNEAMVIFIRLDPCNGIGGKVELPLEVANHLKFDYGDVVTLNIDVEQGKLGLGANGDEARSSRTRAASPSKAAH